jgi:hypothetical protein
LIQTNFSQWFAIFGAGLWAAIVDMDAVNCFPILLWVVLLLVLFIRNRDALRKLSQEPLYAFVFLNILIQTVASASIFGYETGAQYALLRYQPHLLVFGLVITFMLLDTVVASKSLYVLAGIFIVTFNFLTLTFWVQPLARSVPSSWLFPVYAEIFSPRENAWDQVIRQLGSESDNTYSSDVPMVTLPPWTQDIAIFYLGDRYLIRPILQDPDTKPMQALRRTIDGQALNSLFGQPEWIVDFLDDLKTAPAGSKIATVIPSHQARPDDGSRPELTRHAFPQPSVVGNVKLFRLQKN